MITIPRTLGYGDENSMTSSSYSDSSTLRNHLNDEDNSQSRSPYQNKKYSSGGKIRYEPVYLREILSNDYPTSTPVSLFHSREDCCKPYIS